MLRVVLEAVGDAVAKLPGQGVDPFNDPEMVAPDGFMDDVMRFLGFVKLLTVLAAIGMLLGVGITMLAAEQGHGRGMSSGVRTTVVNSAAALFIAGMAVQIAQWLIG